MSIPFAAQSSAVIAGPSTEQQWANWIRFTAEDETLLRAARVCGFYCTNNAENRLNLAAILLRVIRAGECYEVHDK